MWKFISSLFAFSLILSSTAQACSCMCSYDQYVSDFVQDRHIFWGIVLDNTIEQRPNKYDPSWPDEDWVVTRFQIAEGYGRLQKGTIFTSAARARSSCRAKFEPGAADLFMASVKNNHVGRCNCEPPYHHLFAYLRDGKNVYLPNPDQCNEEDAEAMQPPQCAVWHNMSDEYQIYLQERSSVFPTVIFTGPPSPPE